MSDEQQQQAAQKAFEEGVVFDNQRQLEEALQCYEQALGLNPQHRNANLNAALTLEELGRWGEAVQRFLYAQKIEPNFVDGLNRAGDILHTRLGQQQEALTCYERSLALLPTQPAASALAWSRSLCLLALGRYGEGWQAYDARQPNQEEAMGWIHFQHPRWRGEPIAGKRIVLWSEQGFGDVFQFCRYAWVVRDRGAEVFLLVHPKVEKLFQLIFEPQGIRVIVGSAQASPYHLQCPLLGLPLACGTDSVENIPYSRPYLFADQALAQQWAMRLAQDEWMQTNKRRVGMVWASGYRPHDPNWQVMNRRSLHVNDLAALGRADVQERFQFLSLQMEEPAKQLHLLESQDEYGFAIMDVTHGLTDWADTAALIDNLDLVISSDTAVAHLAASMGKPTWVLLHNSACWRWLLHRSDSPWYPSVRLFRQTRADDWGEVMGRVAQALADLAVLGTK